MPYSYLDITLTSINRDGTAVGPALNFTPATTPAALERFAIGNRIRMALRVEADAAGEWTDAYFLLNILQYSTNGLIAAPPINSPVYTSPNGFNGLATDTDGGFSAGAMWLNTARDLSTPALPFTMSLAGAILTINIDFYITADVLSYINGGGNPVNRNRLLRTQNIGGLDTQNFGTQVFSVLSNMGVYMRVEQLLTPIATVQNPFNGLDRWIIPFSARWYNSDYLAVTTNRRFISALQITAPSQVAAGLPALTDNTATAAQAPTDTVDSTYTIINPQAIPQGGQQLAINEKNTVTVTLNGFSHGGGVHSAITDIRAMLIKTDGEYNSLQLWENYYDKSEAIIPAADGSTTQLHKALYTPSAWSQNIGTGEIVVSFDIDGSLLVLGGEYRIVLNIHETANPERATAHISAPLFASYEAVPIPDIDSYIGTYQQEYNCTTLEDVSPHNRIRCRLEIDKSDWDAQAATLELSDTFDSSLLEVEAVFVGITGLGATTETYKPNTLVLPANNEIITAGMVVLQNTAALLNIGAIFRVEEERANTTATVRWRLKFSAPQPYVIEFIQTIDVINFENDITPPRLTGIRFLNPDVYPAQKLDVTSLCGLEYILVEVARDSALLAGTVKFLATIYPQIGGVAGNTENANIEEEESWVPMSLVMPQLTSLKLDAVDMAFVGDFATFLIKVSELTVGQLYWVTGIALEQFPDYCPIGLVQNTIINTLRTATAAPGWAITADYNNFVNEILANGNYIGGTLSVVYARFVGVGGEDLSFATTSPGANQLAVQSINTFYPTLDEVYFELRVDAQFDLGSGAHLVSHTLQALVPRPPVNTGIHNHNSNAYMCTDFGV